MNEKLDRADRRRLRRLIASARREVALAGGQEPRLVARMLAEADRLEETLLDGAARPRLEIRTGDAHAITR